MTVEKKCAAKINLLLDLTGVFSNGYHGIYTIMQSVGLYDTVQVQKAESGISLTCDRPEIPVDEHNTAYKAAKYFLQAARVDAGVHIRIEKQIPSQAGMAGGSADAAGVLAAMNELFDAGLSREQLCRIGARIGADVPFCLVGGTALCQNIGELVTPLPPMPDAGIVCVKPKSGVSTAQAYGAYDQLSFVRHPAKEEALHAYLAGDMQAFYRLSANVFEQAFDVPGRSEIKSVMRAFRCDFSLMTGSGSVVYGIFSNPETAQSCAAAIRRGGREAWVTGPVPCGIK